MGASALRTLQLLELLQRESIVSGARLAEALGVDRRTIRRNIEQLERLGIPVIATRGRDGGYGLVKGYRLPPMMFSDEEATAIVIGLRVVPQYGLAHVQSASRSALAKFERVLPDKTKKRARAIERTISLSARKIEPHAEPVLLGELATAVEQRQRVRLVHSKADGTTTQRDVDPYGVTYLDGFWYLVGYCQLKRDMRSFRLDRIRKAELLPQSFGRDQNFDALAFLKQSIRELPRAYSFEVTIDGPLERIRGILPPMLGGLALSGARVRLTGQADDLDWVARELSRLPFSIRIQRPPELRDALSAHWKRLGKEHEDSIVG